MMYLETIKLKNFRSFEDGVIHLQKDLTVFVGENNGGKSNAIDAIRLLTVPLGGRREIYCEPTDARFQSVSRMFELEGTFSDLSAGQQGRLLSAATHFSEPPLGSSSIVAEWEPNRNYGRVALETCRSQAAMK